ncbi:phage exclusion lipoprotein Cor [Pantoea sp.]|uniref:phage exclusion lipoprotein Cor n=1 Tax=Pantoea sp. TaxID=69393 RepID=UPI0039E55208
MKSLVSVILISIGISGCASSTPPICSNKAKISNHSYDIPVFKKENGRYLAGYPFYTWTDKSQFIDTSECDRLHP